MVKKGRIVISVTKLCNKVGQLTRKQNEIVEYMLSHPDEIRYLSLKEFACRAETSEVSVLKICRELGFDGFTPLKKEFQREGGRICANDEIETLVCTAGSTLSQQQRIDLFHILRENERGNLKNAVDNFDAERVLECGRALLNANDVVIFGRNASKAPSDYLAYRLNYLRVKARTVKLEDPDAVSTVLARMDSCDMAVFFTFPPYYLPTADVVNFALMRGTPIVSITDSPKSPAVVEGGRTFYCDTSVPFFYNAISLPIVFVELLVSGMAMQMGENFDRIIKDELQVSQFLDSHE